MKMEKTVLKIKLFLLRCVTDITESDFAESDSTTVSMTQHRLFCTCEDLRQIETICVNIFQHMSNWPRWARIMERWGGISRHCIFNKLKGLGKTMQNHDNVF